MKQWMRLSPTNGTCACWQERQATLKAHRRGRPPSKRTPLLYRYGRREKGRRGVEVQEDWSRDATDATHPDDTKGAGDEDFAGECKQ